MDRPDQAGASSSRTGRAPWRPRGEDRHAGRTIVSAVGGADAPGDGIRGTDRCQQRGCTSTIIARMSMVHGPHASVTQSNTDRADWLGPRQAFDRRSATWLKHGTWLVRGRPCRLVPMIAAGNTRQRRRAVTSIMIERGFSARRRRYSAASLACPSRLFSVISSFSAASAITVPGGKIASAPAFSARRSPAAARRRRPRS